ncbi:hypothetical protein DRA4_2214 [Lactococcus lactis subsp. lactis bv. diacetylactis]|nr:hypothetical protein LLDT4_09975 [Lactococcus lactis subsp. lactis bv. diacetylactis str. TIFN4]KZK09311.1 hypothetical protein DRA4_2214 [Lactococcus lactis subsp. lactis bv. diacetylactis]
MKISNGVYLDDFVFLFFNSRISIPPKPFVRNSVHIHFLIHCPP